LRSTGIRTAIRCLTTVVRRVVGAAATVRAAAPCATARVPRRAEATGRERPPANVPVRRGAAEVRGSAITGNSAVAGESAGSGIGTLDGCSAARSIETTKTR